MEYGYSVQSDEHQLPIILWVRIDGLNELGYRTSHQVGLIDLIVVADGGHLVLEESRESQACLVVVFLHSGISPKSFLGEQLFFIGLFMGLKSQSFSLIVDILRD